MAKKKKIRKSLKKSARSTPSVDDNTRRNIYRSPQFWIKWGLVFFFIAALAGILIIAVPDDHVHKYPDSGGYLSGAERLLKFDLEALVANRAFIYPLILAFHKATGISHFLTVSLFNLAGLACLAWRLFRRRWHVAACIMTGIGTFLLFSHVNLGFATSYLRESVLIGVTALHFVLLMEAILGPWTIWARIGLITASVLILYHWKVIYVFSFLIAGPFWLWAVSKREGFKGIIRPLIFSLVGTVIICAAVWITNPNNDTALKGGNLIGVLLRTPIPEYYAGRPEIVRDDDVLHALKFMAWCRANLRGKDGYISGDREVNPFLIEPIYKNEFNKSLWAQGDHIYILLTLHDPWHFIPYIAKRAWMLARISFEKGVVCNQPLGEKMGLPRYGCVSFAKGIFYLIPIMLIAGTGVALIRRRLDWDLASAFGVIGMTVGLAMLLGVASYISFDRLFYPCFTYGVFSVPMAAFMLIQHRRRSG